MHRNCGHCGNQASLEKVESVELTRWTQEVDTYGQMSFVRYIDVDRCSVCKDVTIWKFTWAEDWGEALSERRLYPSSRDHSALPPKVRQRLEAADRVRKFDPGLYAVAIRRMLETVFNEQGAEGRDLFHKAKDLVSKEQLPPKIAVAVSHLRDIGKYGAHDEEIEVSANDVPLIEDLANAVLEFVYRAPAAIAALETSVIERGGRITSIN
ncbi:MAG TPA: DUF4145 domain-containing protein [Solirubrobacterales bacterium]|nr:DUF4145 domain-containing protein [Solirubrobacterales bacterium]